MESKHISYDFKKSFSRIDSILDANDNTYEEVDSIPSRDKLTFTNGFYVKCTALFTDICGSSKLPEIHRRPKLAKLYRSFLSEAVAVVNGNECCAEVNIVGDCVSAIFDTPYKPNVQSVFSSAAMINSLVKTLNYKLDQHGIQQIKVGTGISYGRALMIKAGYSGSGINDVIWMGDVVNEASNLAGYANSNWNDKPLMVSEVVYNNLSDKQKSLVEWSSSRQCYHGEVINLSMDEWHDNNCK